MIPGFRDLGHYTVPGQDRQVPGEAGRRERDSGTSPIRAPRRENGMATPAAITAAVVSANGHDARLPRNGTFAVRIIL